MNEWYIGPIAFLVAAAPMLLAAMPSDPAKTGGGPIVKEGKPQSQSRIFDIDKIQDTTPIEAIAMSVLQTRRWNTSHERFYGFDSPPGCL